MRGTYYLLDAVARANRPRPTHRLAIRRPGWFRRLLRRLGLCRRAAK